MPAHTPYHTPMLDSALRMSSPPTLRILSGDREGELVPVNNELLLGRAPDCEVRILDPRVSRRHALITFTEGTLLLEDLGSQNGTVVNSARVRRVQLHHGDLIRIGRERFQVCPGGDPGSRSVYMVEEDTASRRVVRRFDPDRISRPSDMPLDSWFREIGASGDDSDAKRMPWLRRQTRNYAVLFEVSQRVQQLSDTSAMLHSVLEFLVGVLKADRAVVALVDDSPGQLRQEAVMYSDHARPDAIIAISRTIASQVIEGRCGVISHDARADQRFGASESLIAAPTRSLLAVPLPAGARVLGLIELSCSVPGDVFTEDELELMQVVAGMLASALHRRELAADQARNIERLEESRKLLVEQERMLQQSERMARLGRQMQQMVHELNNHLSPLKFASMLKEAHPDNEDVTAHVRMIEETAEAIERIVEDVKKHAHQDAVAAVLTPGRLSGPARSAERFVRYDEDVRPHRMEIVVVADPLVDQDEALLRGVVVNLVRNAGQAIAHDDGHILIRVDQQGDEALLMVSDNGAGIPPHVASRVFEENFTTKGDHGTGVGLHICRKHVEAHGGTLSFETALGEGTTFTIRLPVRQQASDGPEGRQPTISPDGDEATGLFPRPGVHLLDDSRDPITTT